jgi:hypothetical protein
MRTKADEVAKRPLDPMLEIARWPEWGIEQWEEINRTNVPLVRSVLGGDGRGQQQEIPTGDGLSLAAVPSGYRSRAENDPRQNISRIALGIMFGLLFFGGHFYGFETSSADVPALRPVTTEPPSLRSTSIAQPVRHSATEAPAVIPKAAVSQTLPVAISTLLRLPAKGANSVPLLRLYEAS